MKDELISKVMDEVMKKMGASDATSAPAAACCNNGSANCNLTEFVGTAIGHTIGLVIAMLACASGGFMVFHGNDDYFWVITSTSGMRPEVAYKIFPLISILQAITSFACVFVLYLIFL